MQVVLIKDLFFKVNVFFLSITLRSLLISFKYLVTKVEKLAFIGAYSYNLETNTIRQSKNAAVLSVSRGVHKFTASEDTFVCKWYCIFFMLF